MKKLAVFAGLLLSTALVYADCPDGSRTTTSAEREDFVTTNSALKAALPPAPAGWRILDRNVGMNPAAPTSTCKGSTLIPGYFVTYIWTEQEARQRKALDEKDARIRALDQLTPDEQKQIDDLSKQARTLERQAIAVIRTNPDEAARLRKQEEPFILQGRAIRQAHRDRVIPEFEKIRNEVVPGVTGVGTEVNVSISVRKDALIVSPKAEKVAVAGATKAVYDGQDLRMTLGHESKGRSIEVVLTGTRNEAATIANLIAQSSGSLAAKK